VVTIIPTLPAANKKEKWGDGEKCGLVRPGATFYGTIQQMCIIFLGFRTV